MRLSVFFEPDKDPKIFINDNGEPLPLCVALFVAMYTVSVYIVNNYVHTHYAPAHLAGVHDDVSVHTPTVCITPALS